MTNRNRKAVVNQKDKSNHALRYRGSSTTPQDDEDDSDGEKRIWGLSVRLIILSACFVSGFGFIMLYFNAASEMKNVTETNYAELVNSEFNLQNYSFATDRVNIRDNASLQEFTKYFDCQLPVLIRGVVNEWPSMKWNRDFFKSHYGNQKVPVVSVEGAMINAEVKTMTIEEFSQVVPDGKPSRWHYVQDELFINRHDKLKADIGEAIYFKENFFKLFPEEIRPWDAMLLWGSAHSRSHLHIDPYNWTGTNAVLHGRKRWKLFPPGQDNKFYITPNQMCGFPLNCYKYNSPIDSFNIDDEKYPLFRNVNYIEIEQNAGELLIIPPGWFHQVYNPVETIAISSQIMNSKNYNIILKEIIAANKLISDAFPDDIESYSPKEKVLFILALLPDEVIQRGRMITDQIIQQFYGNQ
ncbi:F-box protein [Trichoplax sp. H2]|uniref:JmjC domain-containing protein n=1 Tax=Trichoplax adhaerens TaxID=10228 RepID=B3RKJ9_TRIAD|nr:hypothetical protein TRIADDRAFT_51707 [Trichoplax adhaerens]EDV29415.1 hypothetical protein TRIADDRAFT_51707 [Trichoplax adhaerens]RDD44658.1 F-box protein [Trichoplax sp. H2]|eukprot:XP_002108617.1 hypothetical protein TRIADDRAFT_51707 [Trichoplax adhaerens]